MFVCKNCQKAVLLFDGSLAAKNSDASTLALILAAASKRGNIVLAFSKETQLKFLGRRLTAIMEPHQAPCVLPLPGDSQTVSPVKQLGRIYGVKLSRGNSAFRLDVDKNVPKKEAFHALRKLLGNDLLMQGYPETLRLAHISSTFTAVEVIGIQHYLASNCDLRITIRPNIRRLLFGPFGKGGRDSFH